jgi:type I restriction enzyme S subunit
MSESTGQPTGWTRARVDTLVRLINGYPFKPTQWKTEGLPIIRIQNLNNPNAAFNYCSDAIPEKFRVRNGDLLFAWSGTPGTSFGAHIWRGEDAWLNQHIFNVLFDRKTLDERFLRLAINQNLEAYIRQAHGGAGLAHITKGRFEESELLIAPLPEQRRIVAKIEELFSDLDAGVAALERAKANLKRYRAAVLKAAVEGKLTEQWRADHPDAEPASQLLQRILTERRQKWEADQLAKFAAANKTPPKNWRDKYPEPTPPDTTNLPPLPKNWCWASVEQFCDVGTGTTPSRSNSAFWDGGTIPWVLSTVVNGPYVDQANEFVTPLAIEQTTLRVYPAGTLLIALYGEGKTRGKVTELRFPATINQALGALVFDDSSSILPLYVKCFVSSAYEQLRRQAAGGMQPNLNLGIVKQIAVPLCPLSEQQLIVDVVESRSSEIELAEKAIDTSLARATRLRQSILKQAFEGKLVPQDPRDEPASVLLERLRTTPPASDDPTPAKPRRRRSNASPRGA